jgi:hypothetical protein
MWRARVLIGSVTILLGLVLGIQSAEPPRAKTKAATNSEFVVGEPIRHANLTIFPITSRTPRNIDRFITLDEGLKAGTVEVLELAAETETANAEEVETDDESVELQDPFAEDLQENVGNVQQLRSGGGNSVNTVHVINKSDKPLYLMPGEIVIGGSQDRAIGREYVIQPGGKPFPIEVFCVEHGRWGTREGEELALIVSESTANSERRGSVALSGRDVKQLAKEANQGKFIGSVGNVSKRARIAVQEGKGQSEVWDEVATDNAKSSVKSRSGAFTGNYAEKAAVDRLDPYIGKLQAPVIEQKDVVGVIVAINNKMDSAEILESTPLFKKLWPKLLKSYALDAANASTSKQQKKNCTRKQALVFLAKLQSATTEAGETDGDLQVRRHIGKRLSTLTAFDAKHTPQGGAGMGGGFGGGIHSSGFAK